MKLSRYFFAGVAAIALSISASAYAAWPNKTIEFIIPWGAGGGADIEGRLLAKEMGKVLGVPVIAINKVGAGGAKAYTHTKNAKPDGYTVVWNSTSILTTTNIGNTSFGPDALDHIGQVEFQPLPFAVRADAKWKTFKEFVDDCRKNPGKYKVANSGTGSSIPISCVASA